ncbi:ComEA family DNA-binding protein [Alkalicoccus chagannorensis]|uniref:ComEA family DNA-binding protein n=1 Tax=Alkalicoccus chagannorensis TaxID=427072 RepID=UPI000424ED43|nr:helix-hairpin-helix domain-containing protein [Alkalicoccus chagannorensis]
MKRFLKITAAAAVLWAMMPLVQMIRQRLEKRAYAPSPDTEEAPQQEEHAAEDTYNDEEAASGEDSGAPAEEDTEEQADTDAQPETEEEPAPAPPEDSDDEQEEADTQKESEQLTLEEEEQQEEQEQEEQEQEEDDGIVDVNEADVDDLEGVSGIGRDLAARIVEERQTNGRYDTLDDLTRVRGIGEKKLERLRPGLTVTDK